MIKQNFTNKMYNAAIKKVYDDREFFIKEAKDKADMQAILELAEIKFKFALVSYEDYISISGYFKECLTNGTIQKVGEDYDYIMQQTIEISTIEFASYFLAACKLFIKYSSDYELIVDNGKYTFTFNKDRISEDIYDET